jgi:hypothetical protein
MACFSEGASRGRYFIPQSVQTTMFSAFVKARAANAGGHGGGFHLHVGRSAEHDGFPAAVSTEQSRFDCAVSIEIWRQVQFCSSGRNE